MASGAFRVKVDGLRGFVATRRQTTRDRIQRSFV
jgi:hypothetical protein